jgi:hypothetical protein
MLVKYKTEEFEFYGRRVFKHDIFIGWVTFWEFKYMSRGISHLRVHLARIDTNDAYNVYVLSIPPPEAFKLQSELLTDPVSLLESKNIDSFYKFKYIEKI